MRFRVVTLVEEGHITHGVCVVVYVSVNLVLRLDIDMENTVCADTMMIVKILCKLLHQIELLTTDLIESPIHVKLYIPKGHRSARCVSSTVGLLEN